MSVESRKFIPLMYQLAARLGAKTPENGLFQDVLSKVIVACCCVLVHYRYEVQFINKSHLETHSQTFPKLDERSSHTISNLTSTKNKIEFFKHRIHCN